MSENENNNEKRKVNTFLDPKLLQVLLPLLLAAGSGFMVHDRTLSTVSQTTEQNKIEIKEHSKTLVHLDKYHVDLLSQIESIKSRIVIAEREINSNSEIAMEIRREVIALTQLLEFAKTRLADIQTRIREVEREQDRKK